jgi:pimeloyl-ACP methyl ester carboxylesterase
LTRPDLAPRPRGAPRAAALILSGGVVRGERVPGPLYPPVLRMYPFAADLARVEGLAVHVVRYRAIGWNDGATAADVTAVLDGLRAACGDVATVLVGHSLGARAALAAGGHPLVRGVCALAAWVGPDDTVEQLAGRRLLLAHGDRDRVTSPLGSLVLARRAAASGIDARYVAVRSSGHTLLVRPLVWQRLAREFTRDVLGLATGPPQSLAPARESRV